MRLALRGSHEGPNHPEESTVTTHVRRVLDVIEQSYAERITLNSLGKMIDRPVRELATNRGIVTLHVELYINIP